ncbi:MAG: type II/IV secretion system ATPase subunit [Nanobdellota archaeon]
MAFFHKVKKEDEGKEETQNNNLEEAKEQKTNENDSQNKSEQEEGKPNELSLNKVKKEKELSELELGSKKNLLEGLKQGENVETEVDKVLNVIEEKGSKKFNDIVKETSVNKEKVTNFLDVLEKEGLVEVKYPSNPFSPPVISIKKKEYDISALKDEEIKQEKKLIEKYTVISDYVVADVNIWAIPFENTPVYEVVPHELSKGSRAMISTLMEKIARSIPLKVEDITDPRKMLELKKTFYDKSKSLIKEIIPDIDEKKLKVLAGVLLHDSYGLGDMDVIMSDNWLEEVAINGANQPISLYHRKYGWLKSTKKFKSEQEIYNFSSQIGRKVGKQINSLTPIMDAHLLTGDRVAATLFPISTEGDTLTIRRFSRNPWTITHMVDPNNHTMSLEMMAFLWMCIQYELNILVVGGTASGKTSVLNTLSSLTPPTNRIISIEDTREISLPEPLHWNWVPLNSRAKNAEGAGEVTMLDLMVASLRMRPDRIIVGEIRRKEQAEAMFEAMHTGHSVSATMHADTAEQCKRRLTQPPINIPETEIRALHLILVQYRDRRRGIRRTLEMAEILAGSADQGIDLNYLYRWRPRRDVFEKDNESTRIFEELNLHTGMTFKEMKDNIKEKKDILQWLLDNNIKDVNKVGQIMSIYYKYPELLMDTIKDNKSIKGIGKEEDK